MSAETAVLGGILRDNNVYRDADMLTGGDFEDGRLGAVFDGMVSVIAAGGSVDAASAVAYFPDWGVHGFTEADPWRWLDDAPTVLYGAAVVVRKAAVRRRAQTVLKTALDELSDTGNDPERVVESVNRGLIEPDRGTLDAVSLRSVLDMPDVQDWVIPNLMEAKDRLILTGHEGMGKTYLVRQLLLMSAAGVHPFTSERMDPVNVLVVDAENTARQWMRATQGLVRQLNAMTKTDVAGRVKLSLSGRIDLTNPHQLGDIHRMIDRHKPRVVAVGPLYRLAVHMNSDDDVAPVIAALDTIRDRGVALVIEAHAGHALGAGGVRDVRPRGSSALLGWPEFGFGIRKAQDDTEAFDFVPWRGAREERAWPHQLRRGVWERGEWPWVPVEVWA